jgi:hypothetical protein
VAASAAVGVRVADPTTDPAWEAYAAAHPRSVVFHRAAWLRVLAREYGQRPLGLVAEDADGAVRGILPLVETRGLPLGLGSGSGGRRLSSLPRTPVAGPVADDDATTAVLVRAAIDRVPPGAGLQLKLGGPELDAVVPELTGHPWRMNYAVDLPADPAELRFGRGRDNNRLRAAVRRALRSGLSVRPAASWNELRRWYGLYLETMRDHAVPPRRFRLFAAIWAELAPVGMAELLLVERGGVPIAGNLVVSDGRTAFYLFNGAARARLAEGANNVLQFEAIQRAIATGHRRYDLGEVVEGDAGLARFKRKWGAEPERLHRYYHPAPTGPPDPGAGEPGAVRGAVERAWSRVPLSMTAGAGTVVYRYL